MHPLTQAMLDAIRNVANANTRTDAEDIRLAEYFRDNARDAWVAAGCPDAGGPRAVVDAVGGPLSNCLTCAFASRSDCTAPDNRAIDAWVGANTNAAGDPHPTATDCPGWKARG